MGLASLLLGETNPFAQFASSNSNLLGALGAGLASGPDFSSGIAQGLKLAPQAKALDLQASEKKKADAKLEAQTNATQAWVEANYPQYAHLPPAESFKLAMQAEQQKYGGAATSYSQTPVFLTDDKGIQHAGQMSSGGGIYIDGKVMPGIPEGWKVVARPDNLSTVDMGGYRGTFDPNTGTYSTGPAIQGAPSANMDVTMNPDGTRQMTAAPGSPEATKVRGDKAKAQLSLDLISQKQSVVSSNIDRALQVAQTIPATGAWSLLNAVPGTPQYDLAKTIDTIKANIGFDQLQQMRESSPTGGALGAVSEQENVLLQSVLGSLDQAQSAEQFIANLQFLKQILAQSNDARRRAFAQDFGDIGTPQQPGANPPAQGTSADPLGIR